jgi:uncharacterized protein (TIGR00369 family)
MSELERLQLQIKPLFPGLIGVQLTEAGAERICATLLVKPELCTAGGIMHGGAYMAFADTLGAIGTIVNLPAGASTTTIESKTNFFSGAKVATTVSAESTPLHRGRSTQVWTTRISNAEGKLCAIVTQTQMVLYPKS